MCIDGIIGKVELNGKIDEIVRLQRDRYILKVRGMVEVSIGAEHLFVPTQKHVAIPTVTSHTQVKSNYEEPSPKRNKVHEKLRDMGFDPDKIDKYVTCGLTCHQALEDILEDDAKHTHTHSRSHPVVRSTALAVHTPVLAVWPEDGRRYPGRIEATHGEIEMLFLERHVSY